MPPTYTKTNLAEYWQNAKNGKRNLSFVVLLMILFCACGGLSSAFYGGTNTGSPGLANSGQGSTSANNQNNGQNVMTPSPTDILLPTDTPVPTESPNKYKASATSVTVSDLAKDPNGYQGKTIKFTAIIFNFVQDSSGNTTAANVVDPNDYSSVVLIEFTPGFSLAHVNKNDTIQVWGQGKGAISGTNAYGGTITECDVQEVYLHDATTGYNDNSVTDPGSFSGNS